VAISFSPFTWVGDEALLLVRNNDIYYQVGFFKLVLSISNLYHQPNLSKNDTIRLTDTGKDGVIYNGVTDWLYEGMSI
jgi:hypothetical protein